MIEARALGARAGRFALEEIDLAVPGGAWGVVIGPAGAGKTTLLETIAGVVRQTAGTLRLAAPSGTPRDATALPPEARGVGIVYQHAHLFPHLSVRENVAYGARDAGAAAELVERLALAPLLGRRPASLSGGERQLVALARALAPRPGILLLDEPFGALDPRRRELVRQAVRALHRERGLTVLQVTHDFAEAGLLGDVAFLMDGGRIVQQGAPEQLFRRPASPWAAAFLGAENLWSGTARRHSPAGEEGAALYEFRAGALVLEAVGTVPEGPCHAMLRAEDVVIARAAEGEPPVSSARNRLRGQLREIAILGALARLTLDVDGTPLIATVTARSARELGLAPGDVVVATIKATAVHLC